MAACETCPMQVSIDVAREALEAGTYDAAYPTENRRKTTVASLALREALFRSVVEKLDRCTGAAKSSSNMLVCPAEGALKDAEGYIYGPNPNNGSMFDHSKITEEDTKHSPGGHYL